MPPLWDLPTRLFHWALVACVTAAAATGFLAPEWWLERHVLAGYGVGLLVVFRLVWGVLGSTPSRFRSFAHGPRKVAAHLAGVLRGRGWGRPGHTPAGGWMIFAMLLVLAGLVGSGLMAYGGVEKHGPLAGLLSFDLGHAAEELHEALAWALLGLIAGHLLGVLVESLLERENLVRAMITGHRRMTSGAVGPARRGLATVVLAVLGLGLGGGWPLLAALPARGLPAPVEHAAYKAECGACHEAYHPSLLPADSWRRMMAGLDDHFGESAVLPAATRQAVGDFLATNASEAWDSEAAHRLRRVATEEPLRITATPFWRRKHHDIPDAVFRRKGIFWRGHCSACHRDAASGTFFDANITIPEE